MPEKIRILVVDDEASIRSFLQDALSSEYDVATAADGVEGIEAATAADFTVALVDINMPRADGIEVLNAIRAAGKQTEVVMLTAYAAVDTAVEAVRLGAFDYLTKPARTHDIRRVVHNAAEKGRLARENRELLAKLTEANRQLRQHINHVEKFSQMTERLSNENAALAGSLRMSNEDLARRIQEATRDLDRANALLSDNYLATIKSLAYAIEMKDTYTRGHSDRVAAYTVAMARKLGIDEDRVTFVNYATILHDVGKVGIGDGILTKESALTDAEYATIRLHAQMGDALLQNVGFLDPVRAIVRSHHEWYDGRGYPDGLAGDAIPKEARIVSVADAFDAMTSNRAYRKALPELEAVSRLEKGAGTQFDPELVRLFAAMATDLRASVKDNG